MSKFADDQDLARIRGEIARIERESHTTLKFQNDLMNFIEEHRFNGFSIVEVGCYLGGLTAQLAYAAKKFAQAFDVIDIDHNYLNTAANTLDQVGLAGQARFHAMDLPTFVRNSPGYSKPTLVFVDGDHRYDGVVADVRAIKAFTVKPYACAFHDFSLRYADGELTNVRVDLAVKNEFGSETQFNPIGEIAGQGGLRTEPGHDRHFHERGQPEGVLIVLG